MESTEESNVSPKGPEEKSTLSAAQRRAEIRRRKLLMNSEDRMNRIVGFTNNQTENNVSPRLSPFVPEVSSSSHHHSGTQERRRSSQFDSSEILGGVGGVGVEEEVVVGAAGVRQRPRGELSGDEPNRSPGRGLQKYLSRFDDAMKANEKQAQDGGTDPEELDSFRVFRLVGSVLLAIFVRVFVCKYLSIFAPFLTLELAYMGLFKYFPKVERKMQSTVLTAALLLSGIPAEVINRSMDTYRRMGDVFADLCAYFFTFILCHEVLLLIGSEAP